MRRSIASRFALIFSSLVFIATATVGFMVYRGALEALLTASTDRLGHAAEVIKVRFVSNLEGIARDLRFLAETPPVQGLVRVRTLRPLGFRLDPETAISDDEWRDQLAALLTVFLENRASYVNISFVEQANGGLELVRIEKRDGAIHRVPRNELRRYGDEPYFQEVMRLPRNTVYLSDLRLHREGTPPDETATPRTQIAIPVYSQTDQAFGFLLVDVNLRETFLSLQELASPAELRITNAAGDFLVHPGTRFSSARDSVYKLQREFPQVRPLLDQVVDVLRIERADTGEGEPVSAYFERINFSQGLQSHSILLGVTTPHEETLAGVRGVRDRSILITLLFSLSGIALALAFSRYLSQPLSQISRAISVFGREDWEEQLPVDRQDEIGVLARAFDTMARQIRDQVIALEHEERRQRTILETSAEGIIVTDALGRVETFNPAAEQILGYRADEVMGLRASRFIRPATDDLLHGDGEIEAWMELAQGDEAAGYRQDGHRVPLSVTWSSFELAGEKRYTIFFQDITERKTAEHLREQLLQELEEERTSLQKLSETLEERVRQRTDDLLRINRALEQRNRELQDFAFVASHDLQEPLRKIRSFADLLLSEHAPALNKDARFYLERMCSAAERLSLLITDLLTFSQTTQELPFEEISLQDVAEDVLAELELLRQELGGRITVKENLPVIDADPAQMRQLFRQLVTNGLKFRKPNVPPVVEIEGHLEPVASGQQERVCRIHIKDNGIGFDQKYADRIFAPFQRLNPTEEQEGTGMGLTICRRIVDRHDGSIEVRSTPGEGTCFIITLPAHRRLQQVDRGDVLAEG